MLVAFLFVIVLPAAEVIDFALQKCELLFMFAAKIGHGPRCFEVCFVYRLKLLEQRYDVSVQNSHQLIQIVDSRHV